MCYYVNLDSDEFENVMDEYNFTTIPFTIVKYKKDKRNFSGVLSKDNIIEIINNMKNFQFFKRGVYIKNCKKLSGLKK